MRFLIRNILYIIKRTVININNYSYNPTVKQYDRRSPSHAELMIKAVFSSKAVFIMLILLLLSCAANLCIAAAAYSFTDKFFDSESFREYYMFFFEDRNVNIETLYIGLKSTMNFVGILFIALAVGDAWAFGGTLTAYLNSKNPDTSPRVGLTVIQALSVTKLILEILPSVLMILVLCEAMSEARNGFIVYIFLIVWIIFRLIQSASLIAAISSVKKAWDGIWFSSLGCGTLQFSSMITGIMTTIAACVSCLLLYTSNETYHNEMYVPESIQNDIAAVRLFWIFCIVFGLVLAIINFIIFIIARHYSKKLPLAINAQNAYYHNMANLYPDMYQNAPFAPQKQPYYQPTQPSYQQSTYRPEEYYYHSMTPPDNTNYPPYPENNSYQDFPDNTNYSSYPENNSYQSFPDDNHRSY